METNGGCLDSNEKISTVYVHNGDTTWYNPILMTSLTLKNDHNSFRGFPDVTVPTPRGAPTLLAGVASKRSSKGNASPSSAKGAVKALKSSTCTAPRVEPSWIWGVKLELRGGTEA